MSFRRIGICLLLMVLSAAGGYGYAYVTLDRSTPRTFKAGDVLIGTVIRVADGDTLTIEREHDVVRIRLHGVSAAEVPHPGIPYKPSAEEIRQGSKAKEWMSAQALNQTATCTVTDNRPTHDRWPSTCTIHGKDIGAEIIIARLARACPNPRYGGQQYVHLENKENEKLILADYCKIKK